MLFRLCWWFCLGLVECVFVRSPVTLVIGSWVRVLNLLVVSSCIWSLLVSTIDVDLAVYLLKREKDLFVLVFVIINKGAEVVSELKGQLLPVFWVFDRHVFIHGVWRKLFKNAEWKFTLNYPLHFEVVSKLNLDIIVVDEELFAVLRVRQTFHQRKSLEISRFIYWKY